MLERSLGPGRVRAEASVDFDYEQLRETKESYDPEGQVVRSTQSVTNNSKTSEQAPTVSVQNNLPNADAGKEGAGTSESRQEETTNYEIAKVVRTVVRDQPRLSRLSIAVMVDGVTAKGEDGAVVWKERPADELDRITRLVRSAIGFDEKRGDRVEVVSMRFASDAEAEADGQAGALFMGLERGDIMRLAQTLVFGVLGLIAVMFVLRPMVGRLTTVQQLHLAGGADGMLALADGHMEPGALGLTTAGGLPALTGPGGQARIGSGGAQGAALGGAQGGSPEDESMINIVNIEGQLRASSVRRIADLIDKHPDESLSIMRAWMHQEAA
jgi:flagellar M-ring protein FliF